MKKELVEKVVKIIEVKVKLNNCIKNEYGYRLESTKDELLDKVVEPIPTEVKELIESCMANIKSQYEKLMIEVNESIDTYIEKNL